MGLGGYIFCEWDSIQKEFPDFQRAFAELESRVIAKCDAEWAPKTIGYLTPRGDQYGRTSIIPALFDDNTGTQMATWRQTITTAGHQTLITGTRAGNTLPEDFKVAWIGLAFPNKQQHITELKWQIGDRKYGRINVEEIHAYEKPAIIFENGLIIDEEQSFDLYGYVEGPIPVDHEGNEQIYQSIVMLGAAYFKFVDKVLGNTGAAI